MKCEGRGPGLTETVFDGSVSLTAGYGPKDFGPDGTSGDLSILLHHLQYGTFAYTGMRVLPMFTAMEADSADAARLAAWEVTVRRRARTPATTEPLTLRPLSFQRDVRASKSFDAHPRFRAPRRRRSKFGKHLESVKG